LIANQSVDNIPIGQWFFLPGTETSVILTGKSCDQYDMCILRFKRRSGDDDAIQLHRWDGLKVKIGKPAKGKERRQIRG